MLGYNQFIDFPIICILRYEMTLLVFIWFQKGIRSDYSYRDSSIIRGVIGSLKTCILITATLLFFIIYLPNTFKDYIIKVDVFLVVLRLQNAWLKIIYVFILIITDEDLILTLENQ